MKPVEKAVDPEIKLELAALRRAARYARRLSEETGTPFYVMKKGKIVDLNAGAKPKKRKNPYPHIF